MFPKKKKKIIERIILNSQNFFFLKFLVRKQIRPTVPVRFPPKNLNRSLLKKRKKIVGLKKRSRIIFLGGFVETFQVCTNHSFSPYFTLFIAIPKKNFFFKKTLLFSKILLLLLSTRFLEVHP